MAFVSQELDEDDAPDLGAKLMGGGGSRLLSDIPMVELEEGEVRLRIDGVLGEMARPVDRMAVSIRINYLATMADVKRKIWEVCNMSPYVQRLYLNGQDLPDDVTLEDLGLPLELQAERLPYDPDQGALLLEAAGTGDLGAAVQAIEMLADPNCPNPEDREYGPLHAAAENASTDILSFLLQIKALTERAMDGEITALHLACKKDASEATQLLLEANATVNRAGDNEYAALHYASAGGFADLTQLLLDARADPLQPASCWTPMHLAAKQGHTKVCEVLCNFGVDCNFPTGHESPMTPLHISTAVGKGDLIRMFFNAGAQPGITLGGGWTPLHMAALMGKKDVIKILIKGRAEVDQTLSTDGITALHLAVAGKQDQIVQSLLKWNARTEMVMTGDLTALHMACANGHLDVCKILLKKSAFPNKLRMYDLASPLILAAEGSYHKIAAALVEVEADVHHRRADGYIALHVSAEKGDAEMCSILCKGGTNYDLPVHDGKLRLPSLTPVGGWTAMYLAADNDCKDVVDKLLAIKADANISANDGRTPLHTAAHKGFADVCRMLAQGKADPNAAMRGGSTPLHMAAHQGHLEVVMHLLVANAQLEAANDEGWTPLFMAASAEQLDVVEYLTKAGAKSEAAVAAAERTEHEPLMQTMRELHLTDR